MSKQAETVVRGHVGNRGAVTFTYSVPWHHHSPPLQPADQLPSRSCCVPGSTPRRSTPCRVTASHQAHPRKAKARVAARLLKPNAQLPYRHRQFLECLCAQLCLGLCRARGDTARLPPQTAHTFIARRFRPVERPAFPPLILGSRPRHQSLDSSVCPWRPFTATSLTQTASKTS